MARQRRAADIQGARLPAAWAEAQRAGFPPAALPPALNPDTWAGDAQARWEAARKREEATRQHVVERNGRDAAEEHRTVLLGTEVTSVIGQEEAAVYGALRCVEGTAGVRHLAAALDRLRFAAQAVDRVQREERDLGPEAAASALWAANCNLERVAGHVYVSRHTNPAQAAKHASVLMQSWLLPCDDSLGVARLRRSLHYLSSKLRDRQAGLQAAADAHAACAAQLKSVSLDALQKGLDVLRLQVQLLRLWRQVHVQCLKMEVATNEKDRIREEVEDAAQGHVTPGASQRFRRMPPGELRAACARLRASCEELRARKAFFENQIQAPDNVAHGSDRGRATDAARSMMNEQPRAVPPSSALPELAEAVDAALPLARPAAEDPCPGGPASTTGVRAPPPAAPNPPCRCHTGVSLALHRWWRCCCRRPGTTTAAAAARVQTPPRAPSLTSSAPQPRASSTLIDLTTHADAEPGPGALPHLQQAPMDDRPGNGTECAVCLAALEEGDTLMIYACGHFFCKDCSDVVLSGRKPRCPICRRDVVPSQVFRAVAGQQGGPSHNPELNPPEGPSVVNVKVVGSWMTKVEALVRRLLLLRQAAPDEKALVFTNFPAALDLVSKALQANGVGHVSVGGLRAGRIPSRDAVARFNTDPDVAAFLLTLHHGAAGLTLVRANHVLVLDVCADVAVEQQAIARVHRIGQARPVTVTRLLCAGTVEVQMAEALRRQQAAFNDGAARAVRVEGEEEAGLEGRADPLHGRAGQRTADIRLTAPEDHGDAVPSGSGSQPLLRSANSQRVWDRAPSAPGRDAPGGGGDAASSLPLQPSSAVAHQQRGGTELQVAEVSRLLDLL